MTNDRPSVWGVHAGATGDGDDLFLQRNVAALGWVNLGDLSALPNDQAAFKARVLAANPGIKPGAAANWAGQLWRFIYEMKTGDIVVYPSKVDRRMHIGRVTGQYTYDPSGTPAYPQRRSVTWEAHVRREAFSQGALYAMNAYMTFFAVKNYADDYLSAITGAAAPPPVDKDPTVALVTEGIQENTTDFILKRLSQELMGHPFAGFVANLLYTMGYRSRVSPPGPDGGVDILAHKDELGFEPPIVKVQVKSGSGSIGQPEVSALLGTLSHGEYALVVTLGSFTNAARLFAKGKSNLRLIDGTALVDLILEHYEQLDSRYKGLLPLKHVYIPEAIPDQS